MCGTLLCPVPGQPSEQQYFQGLHFVYCFLLLGGSKKKGCGINGCVAEGGINIDRAWTLPLAYKKDVGSINV